jgi:hypothetical protein
MNDYRTNYLKSRWWREFVRKMRRSGYLDRCFVCFVEHSSETHIEPHHTSYKRLWGELIEDIIPLCESCHAKAHDKVRHWGYKLDSVHVKMLEERMRDGHEPRLAWEIANDMLVY